MYLPQRNSVHITHRGIVYVVHAGYRVTLYVGYIRYRVTVNVGYIGYRVIVYVGHIGGIEVTRLGGESVGCARRRQIHLCYDLFGIKPPIQQPMHIIMLTRRCLSIFGIELILIK